MKGRRHRQGEDTGGGGESRKTGRTGEECVYTIPEVFPSPKEIDRQTAVYREEEEEVEEEGEQAKKQRMNKESQDGNKRGPETSGGEKPMHPEPLYKYPLRRVDDGKRMETG